MSSVELEPNESWLTNEDLDAARERLPILYVQAVPVRVDHTGTIKQVGLLLRADEQGSIAREVPGGRVLYHERIRDALLRHCEKDLGPMALPRIPISPVPFTVAEYFPTPGVTAYHDPRQHAVSLAFTVAVTGDCHPSQDSLDLVWVTPAEALDPSVQKEMAGGHGLLVRQALMQAGFPA